MAMRILNQMIKKEALLELTKNYEKFTAVLTEPKDKDSRVEIRGVPENTIVIKLDSFPDTRTLFNGSRGECKRADYIIISDYNGKKRILFIEMKKTKAQEKDLVKQLKGAACVISYCKEVAK